MNACLSTDGHARRVDFVNAGAIGGLANITPDITLSLLRFQYAPERTVSRVQCLPLFSILQVSKHVQTITHINLKHDYF